MVSDDAAVTEVYEGAGGLLSGEVAGRLFVEMSTVRPATHVQIGKAVEAAGGRFIECPVGGSVKVASEGKLLGFAGGDASDVERARPVLEALCRRIDHAGPLGAGAALKLAINLPLLVYWQALGEAVSLTDGYGFDPNWLIELFSESSGGPNALKVRGPNIAKALAGEDVPLSVDLSTMRKDLGLMLAEAKAKGNASPLVEQVFASFGRAEQAGFAGIDCSAFIGRTGQSAWLSMARIALVTPSNRDIGGATARRAARGLQSRGDPMAVVGRGVIRGRRGAAGDRRAMRKYRCMPRPA